MQCKVYPAPSLYGEKHPQFLAPNFTSERWTSMELLRLDNVPVWQSGFGCPCPDPRDLTNVSGLGHKSPGYILKGSLGLPTMPIENYPETCPFCMYGLW